MDGRGGGGRVGGGGGREGLLMCLEDGVGSPHEELVKLQLQVIQGGRRRQGAVVRLEVEPVV